MSMACNAANDQKLALLSGVGADAKADLAVPNIIPSLLSTIAFEEELFGAVVLFTVP